MYPLRHAISHNLKTGNNATGIVVQQSELRSHPARSREQQVRVCESSRCASVLATLRTLALEHMHMCECSLAACYDDKAFRSGPHTAIALEGAKLLKALV
eukprot:6180406-Pleurochrysis_carterae.AAC.3